MKCILCNKKLASWNKVEFCTKCYIKSPQYLKYQARKQREWFAKPENKKKKRDYAKKNKEKTRAYQRKYQKENIERVRELKRKWANEHREERKEYLKKWRKKNAN